ncbi:uncharacterized protein SPPG_03526 [Spizellomyces punctatus DAOM BR117]|uniref:Late endosomal/lysosomal adaptor and MAPK and MTOR activator 5 n=1 Tax=Spizellomyces punctatus (strain DAOM BR117) TaxID=645134 RepID=A0A0L0HL08_SPIPD|nr:uncharacterized protein SPPG_03526 [Spizellomyces punctatus DAOM BR117]KND01733.1 hypothetical protein SPPG_03526 [Spizellomyces punctatus DAOM BR117]|eukprot:XP_016609772.1 hypothetical protein SPPG_03526 [Spizellomyces punctatus DAOM BR117]
MESKLDTALDSAYESVVSLAATFGANPRLTSTARLSSNQTESVTGILLVDSEGLCLSAKGVAPPLAAGYIASIALRASRLAQHHSSNTEKDDSLPTVCIESSAMNILIRQDDEMTLAVYKTA